MEFVMQQACNTILQKSVRGIQLKVSTAKCLMKKYAENGIGKNND